MRHFILRLAIVIVAALVARSGLAENVERTISVSGQGIATAPPDMATIQTGVVTQAVQASDALVANNKALREILDVLKEQNVASKDIQTSNFDVQPEYQRGPRGQQQPEIIGYRVTNQVRVRVRNLPNLGKVLDSLVDAGSNQISGISFGIDDPKGVLDQARYRAVADARNRAELYAHAAGVRVGKVLAISEQAAHVPSPPFIGRAMAAEAASSVPVATGEQEVRATINIVYALGDRE